MRRFGYIASLGPKQNIYCYTVNCILYPITKCQENPIRFDPPNSMANFIYHRSSLNLHKVYSRCTTDFQMISRLIDICKTWRESKLSIRVSYLAWTSFMSKLMLGFFCRHRQRNGMELNLPTCYSFNRHGGIDFGLLKTTSMPKTFASKYNKYLSSE